jgi:uncharacterized protein YkwD
MAHDTRPATSAAPRASRGGTGARLTAALRHGGRGLLAGGLALLVSATGVAASAPFGASPAPVQIAAGAPGAGGAHGATAVLAQAGGTAPTTAPAAPSALESELLALINLARAAVGVAPLAWDPLASGVARAHGQDMISNSFMSHASSNGASPLDRLVAAGLGDADYAENIWFADTVAQAHQELMEDPLEFFAHRDNILNPAFTRVGLAVILRADGSLVVVEEFLGEGTPP